MIENTEQLNDLAAAVNAEKVDAKKDTILVSMGTCGIAAGATPVFEALEAEVKKQIRQNQACLYNIRMNP